VQRELRNQGRADVSFPVVFTSTLGFDRSNQSPMAELVYSMSQTPQVWIDSQVSESDGILNIDWDCIENIFEEGVLDDMFVSYCDVLTTLADSVT
jgi:non-ribosomal peptide synthetase component F